MRNWYILANESIKIIFKSKESDKTKLDEKCVQESFIGLFSVFLLCYLKRSNMTHLYRQKIGTSPYTIRK